MKDNNFVKLAESGLESLKIKVLDRERKMNRAGGLIGLIGGIIVLFPHIRLAFFPESDFAFFLPKEDFQMIGLLICILGAVILDRAIAIFLLLFAILSYLLVVIFF